MENLINELYYGNICPVGQMGRTTPEEKEILKRIHENEEKLRATLDEQGRAILDVINDDCIKASAGSCALVPLTGLKKQQVRHL